MKQEPMEATKSDMKKKHIKVKSKLKNHLNN